MTTHDVDGSSSHTSGAPSTDHPSGPDGGSPAPERALSLEFVSEAVAGVIGSGHAHGSDPAAADRLDRAGAMDPLTGLPDRVAFLARAEKTLAGKTDGAAVALLVVDVDGFDLVVDTCGHLAGDEVLIQVAERITALVESDDLVGRLSDSAFAVLAPVRDGRSADKLATAIRLHLVQAPCSAGGQDFTPRVSMGLTLSDGCPAAEALRRASVAARRARDAGGGRVSTWRPDLDPTGVLPVGQPARLEPSPGESGGSKSFIDLATHFSQFADASPLGIIAIDSLGRLSEANPAACRMIGRDPYDLVGIYAADVIEPEDLGRVSYRFIELLTEDHEFGREEIRLLRPDGTHVPIALSMISVARDDGTRSAIGLLEELTEQRRLEVELRHTQKLEAVGRLAGGIAHEINTPIQFVGDNLHFLSDATRSLLALVATYQELVEDAGTQCTACRTAAQSAARDADVPFLTEEIPLALEQASSGVERVAAIVRAMKSFGLADTGEPQLTDLDRALGNTLLVAASELRHVADVVTDFGGTPSIMCYPGDLNQVWLNLLVNAAHAISDRPEPVSERGTITVATWSTGTDVVVSIADDGCGMPHEIRDRVFDPFFTTKEVGRGTGQGLTLARSIVEKHGGSIDIDTEEGDGTTVAVRLPLRRGEAAGPR